MVDRKSKYSLLELLPTKHAKEVIDATRRCIKRLPRKIFHTCTYDNGKEFSGHKEISKILGARCYFATSYRSWERGLNEHTNGLIRQYLPKKSEFTTLEHQEVRFIENRLNNRSRKVLGFRTPREVFFKIKRPAKIALQC